MLYLSLPAAFWIRFYLLPNGIITVPLSQYLALGTILTAVQLFAYAAFGLYQSFRKTRLRQELEKIFQEELRRLADYYIESFEEMTLAE